MSEMAEGTAARKAALRKEAAVRRKAAAAAEPGAGAALARHAHLFRASLVAAYRPIRSEIDPLPLAAAIAGPGAAIALPVTVGDHIEFRGWRPGESLARGQLGIEEPEGPEVAPDLLLVPLLAFSRAGGRLGYGAGHYDRYLAARPGLRTVGVAFAAQEMQGLPLERHDVPLMAIATERELIVIEESVCV